MGDVDAKSLWYELVEGLDEMTRDSCIGVELGSGARSEMVRGSSPSESDSTVSRALSVNENSTTIRERWPFLETDFRPQIITEGLGGNHQ